MTHDPRSPEAVQQAQQLQTARWAGYGDGEDAVRAMSREHDELHRLLAGLFDKDSPTLRWVASGYADGAKTHPTRHEDACGWEEDLCLETARWLNTGEFGGTMRCLWFLGVCPDKLRVALCQRLGREGDL